MSQRSPHERPGLRARLLGLFVIFQVIYLPLSNLIQLIPREMPKPTGEFDIHVQREGTLTSVRPVQDSINGLGTAIDRYGELSGQVQAWSLFAPDFERQSVFPIVECMSVHDNMLSRVILPPRNLPADPKHYFRLPGSVSRLCGYDYLLTVIYARYSEQSLRERGEEWRETVLERVRMQQRSLGAYFRTKLRLFHEAHPDSATPQEMILRVLVIPSPPPGSDARPPSITVPLARWLPERETPPGFLPIEAFDPVSKKFVRLPVKEDDR